MGNNAAGVMLYHGVGARRKRALEVMKKDRLDGDFPAGYSRPTYHTLVPPGALVRVLDGSPGIPPTVPE